MKELERVNKIYKSKFDLGELVYLKTDSDKEVRIITGILFRPTGELYYLSTGITETTHYSIEITYDKPFLNY